MKMLNKKKKHVVNLLKEHEFWLFTPVRALHRVLHLKPTNVYPSPTDIYETVSVQHIVVPQTRYFVYFCCKEAALFRKKVNKKRCNKKI